MVLSRTEKIILAYSRTVSGTLSLLASAAILNKIALSSKKRRENSNGTQVGFAAFLSSTTTYQRLLFGLSTLDIMYSFWAALSTLPVPASSGAVFAHGNTVTCSMQGFFTQFSAATPVYIAALTTYFMLRIRYNISEEVLRKKYEFWFHALPILVAVGGAFIGTALRIFNPIALPELGCWIAPYPRGCHLVGGCTKGYRIGELSDYYAWFLAFVWFFVSFFVVLINSVLIYLFMLKQEQRKVLHGAARVQTETAVSRSGTTTLPDNIDHSDNFSSNPPEASTLAMNPACDDDETENQLQDASEGNPNSSAANNSGTRTPQAARRTVKTSRIAAVQCLLYVSTALLTTIWTVMPWIGKKMGVSTEARFTFAFLLNIFNPFQGCFNLVIYCRLQYLRLRATEPEWSRWQCIKFCLFSPDTK
jgi:hypothetical protein